MDEFFSCIYQLLTTALFSFYTKQSMNMLLYLSYVNISVRPIHTGSILM